MGCAPDASTEEVESDAKELERRLNIELGNAYLAGGLRLMPAAPATSCSGGVCLRGGQVHGEWWEAISIYMGGVLLQTYTDRMKSRELLVEQSSKRRPPRRGEHTPGGPCLEACLLPVCPVCMCICLPLQKPCTLLSMPRPACCHWYCWCCLCRVLHMDLSHDDTAHALGKWRRDAGWRQSFLGSLLAWFSPDGQPKARQLLRYPYKVC